MLVFALTIFTGAFLLFQVQPLIAKYILPWFGGGPGVWTACMLFFQVLLLGGYAYAHLLSRWLKPRAQAVVHLVLLAAALAVLPITPSDAWKPTGSENPVWHILALLLVCLGLPYFVLSSTSPLIQRWFSRAHPGRSPYRLYALSNAGSLLALLSYPFFFETQFTRKAQADLWAWGLVVFVLCCGFCALRLWQSAVRRPAAPASPNAEGPVPQTGPGLNGVKAAGSVAAAPAGDSRASSAIGASGLAAHSAHTTPSLQPSSPPAAPAIQSPLPAPPNPGDGGSTLNRLLWLLLPASASVLLLATTNKMCQDVAVIPFLWVLPLALYLLSFIFCFDNPRWYRRLPYTLALILLVILVCWALPQQSDIPLLLVLPVYSAALFVCCMICHGELYRLRPDPEHLTSFYLLIAAGGALGGFFVAVIAPLLFRTYAELPWGLFGCGLLLLISWARDPAAGNSAQWRWLAWTLPLALLVALDRLLAGLPERPGDVLYDYLLGLRIGVGLFLALLVYLALAGRAPIDFRAGFWPSLVLVFVPWAARGRLNGFSHWRRLACAWLGFGVLLLGMGLLLQSHKYAQKRVFMSRNFYGVLSLSEGLKNNPDFHFLAEHHGQTLHGLQFFHPMGATWPTTYFTDDSGVGLAVPTLPKAGRRIGVIGLGVGTLAAYVRTNDSIRFYEINPEVLRIATNRFRYLPHCPGKVECALGDARLSLEREPSQQFDLFALDAFSGDSIPVHLLTDEAFALYDRHLKTNGLIAVHISNKNLDLEPVLANVARKRGYHMAVIESNAFPPPPFWKLAATWVLLTRNPALLDADAIRQAARPPHTPRHPVRLWTDDFTSLYQILKLWPIMPKGAPPSASDAR